MNIWAAYVYLKNTNLIARIQSSYCFCIFINRETAYICDYLFMKIFLHFRNQFCNNFINTRILKTN